MKNDHVNSVILADLFFDKAFELGMTALSLCLLLNIDAVCMQLFGCA